MSLTCALRAIAEQGGCDIDFDELNAALGLSWLVSAVPSEDDLASWLMYARDAFLIEAGCLYGMTIRDLHPPEAARGLSGLQEFGQHFDASYRPLILRALEHAQPVLAWQGWPGDRGLSWGIITNTCEDGIGLAGCLPNPQDVVGTGRAVPGAAPQANGVGDGTSLPSVTLERPPVQLYVVEAMRPTQPDPQELIEVVLNHAQQILDNALEARFGVITGPAAYYAWIDRLDPPDADDTPPRDRRSSRSNDPSFDGESLSRVPLGHRGLTASVLAGHRSAIRFLQRHHPKVSGELRLRLAALTKSCHTVVTSLGECLDMAADDPLLSTPAGRAKLTDAVARARDATKEMFDAFKPAKERPNQQ